MRVDIPGLQKYKLMQRMAQSGLDGALKARFRYAKIKGETLFFVFGHESMRMEFRYKKEEILQRLREFFKSHKTHLTDTGVIFKKIEAVIIRERPDARDARKEVHFNEQSTGAFEINIQDERTRAVMLEIRDIIKKRRADAENG